MLIGVVNGIATAFYKKKYVVTGRVPVEGGSEGTGHHEKPSGIFDLLLNGDFINETRTLSGIENGSVLLLGKIPIFTQLSKMDFSTKPNLPLYLSECMDICDSVLDRIMVENGIETYL